MTRNEIIYYLKGNNDDKLFALAKKTKLETVGDSIYLRGLIELSSLCGKNCYYCGLRRDNNKAGRYTLSEDAALAAIDYACRAGYGSVAIQAGENLAPSFIGMVTNIIRKAIKATNGEIGITLSLGEQPFDTLAEWREAGAERYLLRIESSSRELFESIHPCDDNHSFDKRLETLRELQRLGYQVGTGVMIGLPGQTADNLADDLLFFKSFDIDMCGMGPYLEHCHTPLYERRGELQTTSERFDTTIRMVALLRILMPTINIAATTALQAIDAEGRERAITMGANVVMPNITPIDVRGNYKLYENKPISEDIETSNLSLIERLNSVGKVALFKKGTSLHYEHSAQG